MDSSKFRLVGIFQVPGCTIAVFSWMTLGCRASSSPVVMCCYCNGVMVSMNMKEYFRGYYEPAEDDLKILWDEGTFIVDTSILLELYGQPTQARKETLDALKELKGRLWIPYQVGLEFHRRRVQVIFDASEEVQKYVTPIEDALANLDAELGKPEIERHALRLVSKRRSDIQKWGGELVLAIKKEYEGRVEPRGEDIVLEAFEELFEGCIGPPPDQSRLDAMYKEAEVRFRNKMGPGWGDTDKRNAEFTHGSVYYNRQLGDYVLWRQALDHIHAAALKNVVVLTKDKKDDWWLKFGPDGKRTESWGPHPELRNEMHRVGEVDRFWMYDLRDFLEGARKRLKVKVSEATLEEVTSLPSVVPRSGYWAASGARSRGLGRSGGSWVAGGYGAEVGTFSLVSTLVDRGFRILFELGAAFAGVKVGADGRKFGGICVSGKSLLFDPRGIPLRDACERVMEREQIDFVEVYVEVRTEAEEEKARIERLALKAMLKNSGDMELAFRLYVGNEDSYSLSTSL